MKYIFLVSLFVSLAVASYSQEKTLLAAGASPDIYLDHKITPKENYYSVGRLFNVPPHELAAYNKLTFEKGLSLGASIRIPLGANNFEQSLLPVADTSEALVPVYHIVKPKESLFTLSNTYNRVAPETIKKWNKLKANALTQGSRIIIGYLKVKKQLSPFAKGGIKIIQPAPPKVTQPVNTAAASKPPVIIQESVPPPVKHEAPAPVNQEKVETKDSVVISSINFFGGVFKKLYADQEKGKTEIKESGVAGVFKTTSGWQDGKYYCFHNAAPQGSIIKITNTATGKTIYAKVLDVLPDIKQNAGLLIQLSNAAANELGEGGNRFDCSISYYK